MALVLGFGKRQSPKKRNVSYTPSGMDTGFNEAAAAGGGIQPGGPNSKYANLPVGPANPIDVIRGLFKKKKGAK